MALLPGLTKELILQSIREPRFDHISAIYHLLLDEKEILLTEGGMGGPQRRESSSSSTHESPHHQLIHHSYPTTPSSQQHSYFALPVQRKTSITTGVVDRNPSSPDPTQMPEIHFFLNDSQIFEKVRTGRKTGEVGFGF